jgi:hypothetical protein
MERIRFIRDTVPEREGGPGYKQGDEVDLPANLCERWRSRNAAEYVKQIKQEELKTKEADGNTLEGSAHVDGKDGGDSGERPEHDAGSGDQRPRGKTGKHRG